MVSFQFGRVNVNKGFLCRITDSSSGSGLVVVNAVPECKHNAPHHHIGKFSLLVCTCGVACLENKNTLPELARVVDLRAM